METAKNDREKGGQKRMFEIFRNIWIVNGIIAGCFAILIQLVGIVGAIAKMFEKK